MKIAPLFTALASHKEKFDARIIHTGQHYDEKMSKLFFDDLGMPQPFAYLQVGSGNHGQQTARIVERYEDLILKGERPDLVVVAGDVNSTIACALVAKKLNIPVAHLEAGLRSYDEQMPEEINRVLTDRISDLLLTPSPDADENLVSEGVSRDKIFLVGNIMIDSLALHLQKARESTILEDVGIQTDEPYVLVTLHRPSNVDNQESLTMLLQTLGEISQLLKLVFPIHPRTRKNISKLGLESILANSPGLIVTEPLGYLEFLKLETRATLILTDSGGIQEESTYLGIPCLTLRENTERPITITQGTNQLIKLDSVSIVDAVHKILKGESKQGSIPKFWDGKTAQRVVRVLSDWFERCK